MSCSSWAGENDGVLASVQAENSVFNSFKIVLQASVLVADGAICSPCTSSSKAAGCCNVREGALTSACQALAAT